MPIVYSYSSNKGIKKINNEDAIKIVKNKRKIPLSVICDGVSSHLKSSYSSNLVVNDITEKWQKENIENKEDIISWLHNTISSNNRVIINKSNETKTKMATTIVVTVVTEDIVITANVGDSLTYGITKNKKIYTLTKDDSFAGVLLEAGVITKKEAKNHPKRHSLTQALGVDENIKIHINTYKNEEYEYILSCSDGLTTMLDIEEITDIILNDDLSSSIKKLIEKANERGGIDNISISIFQILRGKNYDR